MPAKTRKEMEAAILRGEGQLYRGADGSLGLATSIDHLPSEADLAAASGDPAVEARTSEDIEKQIAKLRAEQAKLKPRAKDEDAPVAPHVDPKRK